MVESQPPDPRSIKLFGYSERGMINAVCDDVFYSSNPVATLERLLSLISFPIAKPSFDFVTKATFIVEQSFSDFGDLDLLILLDYNDGRKQAVLVEAKVHTDTSTPKTIDRRWREFNEYLSGDKKKTSNVFVQLYRKMRLIRQVDNLNARLSADGVAEKWRLGSNQVVSRAAETLRPYRLEPWYVCLLPDSAQHVETFFTTTLANFQPSPAQLPDWNIERLGFVTWEQIESLANSDPGVWNRTATNFKWNGGQIYRTTPLPLPPGPDAVQQGQIYRLDGNDVLVVVSRKGQGNCRVVPLQTPGPYFPESKKVRKASLEPSETSEVPENLQPTLRETYSWEPPEGASYQTKNRARVLSPPKRVKVIDPGWETSKVVEVNDSGESVGTSFHVFNLHLLRE